ncbi:MAG: class I SAM-dependent methyltransferase, partial [Candidatus Omnitrophota bacterium]
MLWLFVKRVIRKLYRLCNPSKDFFDGQLYWSDRARIYGKKAVINVAYPDEMYDQVKQRDEKEIFPHLKRQLSGTEKTILDLGCGVGRFTAGLALLTGCCVVGVDPTPQLIKTAAKSKSDNTDFKVMKEGKIPLSNRSVDILWTYGVLGCIKGKILIKTIQEMERVLKKDGLLFLVENTTAKPALNHYTYRPFDEYRSMISFAALELLHEYP